MSPRKYANNSGTLTLGSNESYIIKNNCGTVKIGDNCTINCKCNCGNITIGSNCLVNDVSNNCGTITIGQKATVKDASSNAGTIKIGPSSLVQKLRSNVGRILIGDGSTLVEPIKNNVGEVKLGANCASLADNSGLIFTTDTRVTAPVPVNIDVPAPRLLNASAPPLPVQVNEPGFLAPIVPNARINQVPAGEAEMNDGENDNCAICWERKKNMAFKCGHTCCEICAQNLVLCHICRARIELKIKLYG